MTRHYRPWGPVQWLLPRLGDRRWSILGVLGTEERCTSTVEAVRGAPIASRRFLHIRDPLPEAKTELDKRYASIGALLRSHDVADADIREAELLADLDTIRDEVQSFLVDATPHVILDITSMPKCWFFPVIRMLMATDRVETLIATYAGAAKYGDVLSSDPEPLAPIKTFYEPPTRPMNQELIIGVGFAALSLRDLYTADADSVRYLFPFPPGPPNFHRNWDFLRTLEAEIENSSMKEEDRHYVHMFDCPSAFDQITSFTKGGTRTSALAPFGPKPLSLAMCMFALAAADADLPPVHVYYTQPTRYDLDYSRGIARIDGAPDVKAYSLKSGGSAVYRI